jgi:hypothetical protein
MGRGGDVPADSRIVRLSTIAFDEISAYDKAFFPDDRTRFLRCWLGQPQSTALGIVEGRKLAGYGVMRVCRSGYKIGPLFADAPQLADRLFAALRVHAAKDAPIFLDVPEVNAAAVDLAKRHAMTVAFETARMYKGESPDVPIARLFGLTSFELG